MRARIGDTHAFDELFVRHNRMLHRMALSIVRSPVDAQDVTQSAWLQAFRHLEQFRGTATVTTWLGAIVRNEAFNHLRARRRDLGQHEQEHSLCVLDAPSPEEIALSNERRAVLARSILTLSPLLRDALQLWHSGKYTYDEIAQIAGVETGTIRSRIWQARQRVSHSFAATVRA
jgi:RNA polymerase sigma-70 factor (ECF subfamily)